MHNDITARVCVASYPHCFAMYLNVLAYCVLTFWDKSKFHIKALRVKKREGKFDPLIYIAGKIRANSRKLLILLTPPKPYKYLPLELKYAIIKLIQFSGKTWADPQTLRPSISKEPCQTLKE